MHKSFDKNPRYWAMQILNQVLQGSGYSNILLNQCLNNQELSRVDQRLLVQLVYGVLQHKLTLDYFLEPYLKQQKHLQKWVNNLLRVAVYQMHYLDRIPDRAIFYEAAQIAKVIGGHKIAGLVTAVLRNLQRHGFPSLDQVPAIERLSIEYSVPQWLVQRLIQQVGNDKTTSILSSLNHAPKTSIRVNTAKITPSKLQSQLEKDGFKLHPSSISPVGLVIDEGTIIHSPWFQAGFCTIQDESSMLVAPALQLSHSNQVLDACAAPGGKTTHIATYLQDPGRVTALDLHAKKLRLIEQNAHRLGVSNVIQTQALDARLANQKFAFETFDRILVDAPCSGFGLMRRKPEIRYARGELEISHLAQIQSAILEAIAPLLAVGGLLVYSTCTIFTQENQQVIADFLEHHSNFQVVNISTKEPLTAIHRGQFIQIYPDDYQTDGFFIAALQKVH